MDTKKTKYRLMEKESTIAVQSIRLERSSSCLVGLGGEANPPIGPMS